MKRSDRNSAGGPRIPAGATNEANCPTGKSAAEFIPHTASLAVRSDDGLVADDYYKRGLAINQSLDRTAAAAARGLQGTVDIADDGRVDVTLTGRGAWPATVRLRLSHPTQAGADRIVDLPSVGEGLYGGSIVAFMPGRWRVAVEGDGWKLPAAESTGRHVHVMLGAPDA